MDRLAAATLLVVALTGCTEPLSQGDTDTMPQGTDTTSTSTDSLTGECYLGDTTTGLSPPGHAWIVDPIEPMPPLWEAPREVCEHSRIVDLDFTADGTLYVIGANFIYKEACGDTCPWHHWLRRVSAGGEGEKDWAKTFDVFAPIAMRALADGGVVIGGAAIADENRAPWLARYDAAGSLLWEQTFAEHGQINAVAPGPGDVVVAVGSVEAGAAFDLWAVQVASDGALAWTSTQGDDRHESAVAVAVDAAGRSWIVGGRAPEEIDEPPPVGPYRLFGHVYNHYYFDQPLVALVDAQGGLIWLDEPAAVDTTLDSVTEVCLLPGGDAVVGSPIQIGIQWIARYTADGMRVWETLVESVDEYAGWYLDDLECDALGRTHVLSDRRIFQLDDAGVLIDTLETQTNGDQLALSPTGALRVSHYEENLSW